MKIYLTDSDLTFILNLINLYKMQWIENIEVQPLESCLNEILLAHLKNTKGVESVREGNPLDTIVSTTNYMLNATFVANGAIQAWNTSNNTSKSDIKKFLSFTEKGAYPETAGLAYWLAYFYNGVFSSLETAGDTILKENIEFDKIEIKIPPDSTAIFKSVDKKGELTIEAVLEYSICITKVSPLTTSLPDLEEAKWWNSAFDQIRKRQEALTTPFNTYYLRGRGK
jgi:hypothetical protein